MSNFKVNKKLLVAFIGLLLLAGLIPLGLQAIASDEAQTSKAATADKAAETEAAASKDDPKAEKADSSKEANPSKDAESADPAAKNETCTVNWEYDNKCGKIIGQGADVGKIEVEKNTKISAEIKNDIGYIYINKNLILTAYPNEVSKCWGFWKESSSGNESNLEWIIDGDCTFGINFQKVETPKTGILQGWVTTKDKTTGKIVPLKDVEVYYARPGDTTYPYYSYSDENGFYRISNVPFGMDGCLNGYLKGYIAEYSGVITLTADNFGLAADVQMEVGVSATFISYYSDCPFHVKKFYKKGTSAPTLVEELTITDAIRDRVFPEGATIRMMANEECASYDYNIGTLEYKYVYHGATESDNTTYVIHVEPKPTTTIDSIYWGYNHRNKTDAIVPVGSDAPVVLSFDNDPYTFYCSLDEMYLCPINSSTEKFILNYYLNNEKTFGPVDVYSSVALYKGGKTWVDKLGNLHCTLEYEATTSNEKNIYEMVLEPVGKGDSLIYNFYGTTKDGVIDLTVSPTDKILTSLDPEYLPAGKVGFDMVDGISQYTLTVKINGELFYDAIPITADYLGKLYAETQFSVSEDGSLQFVFENEDGYTQEGIINYVTKEGYVANGWNLNDKPVAAGFDVEQGGDYILTANVGTSQNEESAGNSTQTSDNYIMLIAAFAGLALACGYALRRHRILH